MDEIVESQDQKLQEVKRTVFNGVSIPLHLTAEPPVLLSTISDLPSPPLMISTHYNNNNNTSNTHHNHHHNNTSNTNNMSNIMAGGDIMGVASSSCSTSPSDALFSNSCNNSGSSEDSAHDIDFSKPENLFLLEAPIDARKDQNMLKLACTVPKRTFMSRLLRTYPINRKRLAFIQRRSSALKSVEIIGNLIVSSKSGGEGKEITISCQVCGQKFSRQYQFQRHILTHPDPESKKFLCQICGKRFNRADHLNRHAILHGDIKVQKCLLCGEEFDRASHLDRHRRKHHPPAGQQPSQTPPSTPQMKSPTSPGFDGFLTSPPPQMEQQTPGHNLHLLAAVATPEGEAATDDLQLENGVGGVMLGGGGGDTDHTLHVMTGEDTLGGSGGGGVTEPEPDRPYPCEVCGRKFIRATHLRRHMRIHTGEKPFACHICGRRYARGDYLRAHIHAHRRDKIHKCKHCGEVFHDLTRFADHCRLVHKDLDDQFGNPKPPPESSPPPPNFSSFLETALTAEQPEEITVVPSLNAMAMDSSSGVPITLVTLPEADQDDIGISVEENPSHSHHSHSHSHSAHGHVIGHALPTPNHTPMTSPADLQLAQLRTQPEMLLQNGQLQVADMANDGTGFVSVQQQQQHRKVATPISYMDSATTQYIYGNGGGHHGNVNNTATTMYPTPQSSPLVGHPHH